MFNGIKDLVSFKNAKHSCHHISEGYVFKGQALGGLASRKSNLKK